MRASARPPSARPASASDRPTASPTRAPAARKARLGAGLDRRDLQGNRVAERTRIKLYSEARYTPTHLSCDPRRSRLVAKDTLTITDNRTGRTFEVPIEDETIRATDLRQIKVKDDDFGMMTYDPAFMNTAACRS